MPLTISLYRPLFTCTSGISTTITSSSKLCIPNCDYTAILSTLHIIAGINKSAMQAGLAHARTATLLGSLVYCNFMCGLRGYHEYRADWTPTLHEVRPGNLEAHARIPQ